MKTILRLAALSLVTLVLFAPTAAAQGKTTTISIKNFAFDPPNATVAAGTTVTWVNDDQVPHTATADDGAFDSGTLQPGQSYSFTFDKPGTYAYHCNIHPYMTATVTVSSASGSASPTASASASPTASASASPSTSPTASGSASPTASASASPSASASASATAGPGTPLPSSGGGGPSSLGLVAGLVLLALGAVVLILGLVRRGAAS